MEEFYKIYKKILDTNNNIFLKDLFECYNNNKQEIQLVFLSDKNNIIKIKFHLSKINIISLDSYKKVVTKYCEFIDNFFISNEEINERNIKNTIIEIITFLIMKDNIMKYIVNIPEHHEFFYKNGLHFYNENLILESCEKRMNENLYKILVKNLIYYKIKIDLTNNN